MDEALAGSLALPEGHLQGIEGEVGTQVVRRLPADDVARVDVEDERDVDEARPGTHIGQIGDPETVRCAGAEVALDQVIGPRAALMPSRFSCRQTLRGP